MGAPSKAGKAAGLAGTMGLPRLPTKPADDAPPLQPLPAPTAPVAKVAPPAAPPRAPASPAPDTAKRRSSSGKGERITVYVPRDLAAWLGHHCVDAKCSASWAVTEALELLRDRGTQR